MRPYEFYKEPGITYAVTTCDCCNIDGYQDAWVWLHREKQLTHWGVRRSMKGATLITEREARKRAPDLFTMGVILEAGAHARMDCPKGDAR